MGDRFTTNCISYDLQILQMRLQSQLAAYAQLLFMQHQAQMALLLDTAIALETVALQVVGGITTLPNGDYGVKFVVVKAQ